jgi:hypothetical protein
MSMEH